MCPFAAGFILIIGVEFGFLFRIPDNDIAVRLIRRRNYSIIFFDALPVTLNLGACVMYQRNVFLFLLAQLVIEQSFPAADD